MYVYFFGGGELGIFKNLLKFYFLIFVIFLREKEHGMGVVRR